MNEDVQKIIVPNYSYGYAKSTYEKLEQYEVSMQVPPIKENESIIVRLDGKGLTARFKSDTELFLSEFHLAMKITMENIKKYCPYVRFAYSFKDEISLLLDKEQIEKSKDFQNRIEKVLPILSGYISAMFSQYIPKTLKKSPCEAFTFDARIIIIPTVKIKDYFHSRQAFAMSGFIDRICAFRHLTPFSRTFINVKQSLKDVGDDWGNYPQYVSSGYVGRYEKEKWVVDTASDFMQKWYKYEHCL
ncbi:MAG: tRNA(His) guanylyltransferase Thg1 family protein [Clostridiales bacterium]|nr:tRNA(His) guanylyltransferase Thg1 family protein [Clostridiales bacterium]